MRVGQGFVCSDKKNFSIIEKYLEPVCYFAYLSLMVWFLLGIEDTSRCLARWEYYPPLGQLQCCGFM
jgi:hypothetical protein